MREQTVSLRVRGSNRLLVDHELDIQISIVSRKDIKALLKANVPGGYRSIMTITGTAKKDEAANDYHEIAVIKCSNSGIPTETDLVKFYAAVEDFVSKSDQMEFIIIRFPRMDYTHYFLIVEDRS